jgi:hypothetical protein
MLKQLPSSCGHGSPNTFPATSAFLSACWTVRAETTPVCSYSRSPTRHLYTTPKYSKSSLPEYLRHNLSTLLTNNLLALLNLIIFRYPHTSSYLANSSLTASRFYSLPTPQEALRFSPSFQHKRAIVLAPVKAADAPLRDGQEASLDRRSARRLSGCQVGSEGMASLPVPPKEWVSF